MNICVYCSSSDRLDKKYYKEGYEFGKLIGERGHSLVYGGYCRGIMASVAEGVTSADGMIYSVVPDVFDREGFTYEKSGEIIRTSTMSERKKTMEDMSDCFAILPGGIGTLDELLEIFVLSSLGESSKRIAVLNSTGFYDSFAALLDEYVEKGFLDEKALNCVKFFTDEKLMMEFLENDFPFDPVYDEDSKVLILGSYPSVKSRETGFFYGHKQNRFWKVLARVYETAVPDTVEEKLAFLHANHIALWDVVKECDITGSADSSIRNVVPEDISYVLSKADGIEKIYINGQAAAKLYSRYMKDIKVPAYTLPSTSPANAAWTLEKLACEWNAVR